MPTIGRGRVQAQTGTVSFAQAPAPDGPLSSFTLQTPTAGINLFESYSNNSGNVILELRSLVAGNGLKLITNHGVLYISLDAAFTANYAPLDSSGIVPWQNLPTEVQTVPVAYVIPNQPQPYQVYNVVLPIACVIPPNLAGTVVYSGVKAAASADFGLCKISNGETTSIGTVTVTPISNTSCRLSTQAATTLQVGDVLQLVTPLVQDATLSEVGITILALKI